MPPPIPINTSTPYGRLKIINEELASKGGRRVRCRCECGKLIVVFYKSLRTGNTASCGCLRSEKVARKNHKHGAGGRLNRTPEYVAWKQMRQRCNNPGTHEWMNYGGRGITVSSEWDDFATFLKDVGPKPSPAHSLDRIDNNDHYRPGNVRWATSKEQARNKRNTRHIEFEGVKMTASDLADRFKIVNGVTILNRIDRGWTVLEACTTPLKGKRQ